MIEIVQFKLKRLCEKINTDEVIILKDQNKIYTCGRSEHNHIVCRDESISKRHCAFSQNENTLFVEDLGSANGIYINKILQAARKKHPLKEGDVISLCVPEVNTQDINKFCYRVEKEVIVDLDGNNIKIEPPSSDLETESGSKTFSKLAKLAVDKTIPEANDRVKNEKLEVAKNVQVTPPVSYEANAKMNIEFRISDYNGSIPNIYVYQHPNTPNEIQIILKQNSETLNLNPPIQNEPIRAELEETPVEETSVTATPFRSQNTIFDQPEPNIIRDLTKNVASENSRSSIQEKSVTVKVEEPENIDNKCNLGEIMDLDDIPTLKKENSEIEQLECINLDSESDIEVVEVFNKLKTKKPKEKKKKREKKKRKETKTQDDKAVKKEVLEEDNESCEEKNGNKKRKLEKDVVDEVMIDSNSVSTTDADDNVEDSASNIIAKRHSNQELTLRKVTENLELTPEQWQIIKSKYSENSLTNSGDPGPSVVKSIETPSQVFKNRFRDTKILPLSTRISPYRSGNSTGNLHTPSNEIQNDNKEAKKVDAAPYGIDEMQFRYNTEGGKYKPVSFPKNKTFKQYQREIPLEKELCRTVVSWDPKAFSNWFSNPHDLDGNEVKKNSKSYESYKDYRDVFLQLVILDISREIRNAYVVVDRNVSFKHCKIVPGTIRRIFANQLCTNMLNFRITINSSINASKFPKLGDLLRIDITNMISSTIIFAYVVDNPVLEQKKDSTRNVYYCRGQYTVVTKELDFNLNKSTIFQLQVVANIRYSMQLAEAMDYFQYSPLLTIIIKPDPINCHLAASNLPTKLVTKDKLDEKQLNAVMKITGVASRYEPKVILIEGPPGTGKTQVIVNIIFQLLQKQESDKHEKPMKILVCANTEAAIDEIVLRVNSIQKTLMSRDVNMIRLGEVDQMEENTRKFSIQQMSNRYLQSSIENFKLIEDKLTHDQQKRNLAEKIERAKKLLHETKNHGVAMTLPVLEKHLEIKKSGRMIHEYTDEEYNETLKKIQEVMILGQNLITCSINTSFSKRMDQAFRNKNLIPLCIIDDASLVREVDVLQLLLFGVQTLVLVGDNHKHSTKYLSSTTMEKLEIGESLFSRMKKNLNNPKDCPIISLDNEYRMNPEISHFLNSFVYKGILRNRTQSDLCHSIFPYRIFNFLNFIDPAESETNFAVNLILCVMKYAHFENVIKPIKPISIGVVVPYSSSKGVTSTAIETKLAEIPMEERRKFLIDVNTIKGFQNQERDIVFASCIKQKGVQLLLTGKQSLYSTLTIAKHCLVLYGRFEKLQVENQCLWNSLIEDAKQRKVFINIDCSADFEKLKKHMIKTE